jgi:hypothetical protein
MLCRSIEPYKYGAYPLLSYSNFYLDTCETTVVPLPSHLLPYFPLLICITFIFLLLPLLFHNPPLCCAVGLFTFFFLSFLFYLSAFVALPSKSFILFSNAFFVLQSFSTIAHLFFYLQPSLFAVAALFLVLSFSTGTCLVSYLPSPQSVLNP